MKKRSVTPQEEYTGQAPEPVRTTRARKISAKTWIAAVLSLLMSLALTGISNLAYLDSGEKEKLVLFYCDKRFFPYVSMSNALSSAGFDCDVIEVQENTGLPASGEYGIPAEYKGKKIVVASFGKDAFNIMDGIAKTDNADVIGYCLVNPEHPGNAALEGYGRDYPDSPVAIFTGGENTVENGEATGAALLYERLSGADTLYGVPAVSGTLIKSRIYMTPDLNRYLSVSSLSLGQHVIRYSPLFETEFARYLGVTYGSGISDLRATAWFSLAPFTAFAALCFLAFFVFLIPIRDSDKGSKELKGRDSLGGIICFGLSAWIALTICVMTFIPDVAGYARYAAVASPVVLTAIMALMRLPFLLSRKTRFKRDKMQRIAILLPLVMAVCEIALVAGVVNAFTDISGIDQGTVKLAAAMIVFVVSSLSAYVLAKADRKSRFVGEGPASYFGDPVYFIETMIPPAAFLVISITGANGFGICYASLALACGLIPFAAAVTIKRVSDFFEATGVTYGILMGILVYIAL